MKEKYLKAVDDLIDSYDAFYIQNKYSEIDKKTHAEQFNLLCELLEKDDTSMRALGWIKNQYDCYYKKDLEKEENQDNAFNYLRKKIEEEVKE